MKSILRNSAFFLKDAYRARSTIFWMIFFPLLYMICMNFAFAGFRDVEEHHIVLGVDAQNPQLKGLQHMDEGLDLISLKLLSEEEAVSALENKEITAFVREDLDLDISQDGLDQQIARSVINEYRQISKLLSSSIKLGDVLKGQEAIENKIQERLQVISQSSENMLQTEKAELDEFQRIFYTVLACFSLYGYFGASETTGLFQANQSALAQRNVIAPQRKGRGIISGVLMALVGTVLSVILQLLLVEYGLGLNLIHYLLPSVVILLMGGLFGIALGIFFGTLKISAGAKTLVGIFVFNALAFLSGMMGMDIPNALQRRAPWLLKMNPLNILSQGLTRVNLTGKLADALPVVLKMTAFALLFLIPAVLILGKSRYEEL